MLMFIDNVASDTADGDFVGLISIGNVSYSYAYRVKDERSKKKKKLGSEKRKS